MNLGILAMRAEDWPLVREIYAEGIATGNATFETAVPDWTIWDAAHHQHCRLIARDNQRSLAWAASARFRVGVFMPEWRRFLSMSLVLRGDKAFGKALLKFLIECSEKHGIWTLQAGIFAGERCQHCPSQILRIP